MTLDAKILEKVRKLLELAHDNANVSEAANAASAAQTLMSRHAISEAMLIPAGDNTPEEQIEKDLLFDSGGSQNATWRGQLAVPLCEVNSCGVYQSSGSLHIFGRPSDAAKVRYLFAYIAREIERLCAREAAERGSPGRTWSNSFKLGAVAEIARRVRAADAEARSAMRREADAGDTLGSGSAIVLVNNALARIDSHKAAIRSYGQEKLRLRKGSASHARTDHGARDAGRRAAASIDLTGASRGSLGSGSRKSLRA